MEVLLQLGLLVIGFAMLVKGADWFVDGASGIATKFKIPQLVIGLTIVAMGTSAPEAAVSISSALHGSNAIAIGNVVGSNIANIFLILGLTAIFTTLTVQKNTIRYEIPFVGIITILLCWLGASFGVISRASAFVLLGLFVAFLGYLFAISRNTECDTSNIKHMSAVKITLCIVLGLVALVLGSNITVSAACDIARCIGVSERVIGLTIIALGTSLPELVTSVIAARHGESDIAIGNIVGSNIFNILFVIGTSSIITPIVFENSFIFDTVIAIVASVILFFCVIKGRKLRRPGGIFMLVCYAAYLAYIIGWK